MLTTKRMYVDVVRELDRELENARPVNMMSNRTFAECKAKVDGLNSTVELLSDDLSMVADLQA